MITRRVKTWALKNLKEEKPKKLETMMKKSILALAVLATSASVMADIDVNVNVNGNRLKNCREKVKNLKAENNILQSSINSLTSDLSTCRANRGGNSGNLRRRLREANETIDLNNQTINRLENTIDRKNDKISDLRLRIQDLEDQLNPAPVPSETYTINGSVERVPFIYEVVDRVQFFNKCAKQYKNVQSVDDMSIAENFSNERNLRNSSSYWKKAGEVCKVLTANLAGSDVPANLTGKIVVQGDIEGKLINFTSENNVETFRKCERFVSQNGLNSVDDMKLIINGANIKNLRNSSSYWKGSEICNTLVKATR